jgi:hypothetical protein
MLSKLLSWGINLGLSIVTEELVKDLLLEIAKGVAKRSKYKWDDSLVKVLEDHLS